MLLLLAAYVFWLMLRGELSVYAAFATTRNPASAAASGGNTTTPAYVQSGPATFSPGAASGADSPASYPLFGGINLTMPNTPVPTSTGAQTETTLGAYLLKLRQGLFGS